MNKFAYLSTVLPGQRINIHSGISANGNPEFNRKLSSGFMGPIENAVSIASTEPSYFGPFPILVPCDNWTALVQAFYSRFTVDGRPSSFAAAAAMQRHSPRAGDNHNALVERLGIKAEDADDNADASFVMVRVPRIITGADVHLSKTDNKSLWNIVLSDCGSSIDKLQNHLDSIKADELAATSKAIATVIDVIENELGSHIVESLSIGDEAFQIFVYTRQKYKLICNAMDQSGWTDAQGFSFRYFTSPQFLSYRTTPMLLSGDSEFSDVLPLIEDKHYGLGASIFNLLLNKEAQEAANAINSLTCVGASCVSVTAKPTSGVLFMASEETPAANRLSASALIDTVSVQSSIARFGTQLSGLSAVSDYISTSYEQLYSPFKTATPESIFWSPYASLTQPYIHLGEWWNTASTDKSALRHLIVIADVIELQDLIDLSQLDSVTLVCRLLIAGKNGAVPTVKLSKSAWNPLELYCGMMIGTCAFEAAGDPASHRVVYDIGALSLKPDENQVAFENFFSGKYPSKPLCDSSTAPDALWTKNTLQAGIEALLLTSSAVLRPQAILSSTLRQTAVEAWQCLRWINSYLNEIVAPLVKEGKPVPEEVASLYSLAATLLRVALDPKTPASQVIPQVPSLRYTAYQSATTKLLDVAKTYSDELAQANQKIISYSLFLQSKFQNEQRDDMIRQMARFMVDQNEAFAKHEDDLISSHNKIINKNSDSIRALELRHDEIKKQYDEYLTKYNEANTELGDAIKTKMAEMEAKAIISFALGLAEAFGGVMTGIYSFKVAGTSQGIEKTLKQWEAFLKIAETTNKLAEDSMKLAENIGNVVELNNSTPNSFSAPPTDTDWEIFMNDSEAKVRPAEEYVKSEVENFIAAVRNLTVVAKSLNEVLRQKSQLEFNNFTEQCSKQVSENQAARLRTLQMNLGNESKSPSVDYVADLGQFAALLQQKQNCVLNNLAEIAMLQDDSMTFHYLSKPSLITKFDLASIQENLAAQALNAVQMLESYPYPPTNVLQPVEVTAEHICVADLLSDTGITINVSPTLGLFNSMARVRINSVDVRIDGVSTNTGHCHVQMISAGSPMADRGLKRELQNYKTLSREWHVVYDIASDKTIIGTQPSKEWAELFTKPTPFQTWRIMLPKSQDNAGLHVNGATTNVKLIFDVEMMYSAPPPVQAGLEANLKLRAAGGAEPDPTNFLKYLGKSSITDGWDVVSFVSVDRINDLWKQRWQAESDAAFKGETMFVQKIDISHSQPLPGNVRVDYHLESKAGPPCLTFVADGNQSALIDIPLIDGSLTTATYQGDKKLGETTVNIQSSSDKPVTVKTKGALKELPGDVDAFRSVHIDPASGVFALENIVLDPQVDAGFCNEIAEYFKKQQLQPWLLGSLRFQADQDYLKPKSFAFRTYTPPKVRQQEWPSILGIYVLTSSKTPGHEMRQAWPDNTWPVSMDYDAAVYFSANLLWNNEVIPAIKTALPDVVVHEDEKTHEFSAKFTGSMVVCDQTVSLLEGWESQNERKTTAQAKVNFPNSALSLALNLNALELSCNTSWKEKFPYQGRTPCCSSGDCSVALDVAWDDVTVSCSFDSSSAPHIDKDTFNVTFDKIKVTPAVNIDYNIHKFLGIPILSQIQPGIVENAKDALEKKFSGMNIQLGAMSMFAVSNLLFPESKALDPHGVYFPGDMVIVGRVTRQWTPPKK